MAGAFWGIRPPGEQLVEDAGKQLVEDGRRPAHREAHERLVRAVEAKLAQGFTAANDPEETGFRIQRVGP